MPTPCTGRWRKGRKHVAHDHDASGRSQRPRSASAIGGDVAVELSRVFSAVRTERLSLRRPDENDGRAMFRVHGDPKTNRYNPAGPDPDLAASEAALRYWLQQWQDDGFGYWAVAVPPDHEVAGFGGVRRIEWRGREVLNLYYRLAPAAWGRGYATELALTAVSLVRVNLPHLPVVARTRSANLPSIRTAERAGLSRRPDLDTDEHIVFALGWSLPE